ncbi:MAG TPA: hypothetical protein VNY05_28270 [Candidatus Acidoferrales bacterium]|nr:hypothetical protein [Candidatus Acidoferrales bacterium]
MPIRFGRAVTGPPLIDAPDVDDRGFAMGTRPGTWGSTDARGAMLSVTEGDTIRVKVLREDLDDTAPLFVTSTNPAAVAIVGAAGPLSPAGIFSLRGIRDSKNVTVKIQVHLGSADGPVLGEMEPHVFQLRQVRVRAHLVTINGTSTVRTAASLVPLFADVNTIWRAAGIEFLYDQAQTRIGSINGFATAGTVTTDLQNGRFAEFSRVLNLRDPPGDPGPDANAGNVYFVRNSSDPTSNWTGLTLDKESPRPGGFGVVLLDRGNAHELAHELGHLLNLDIHAGENGAGTHFRDDVASERRMMFDFSPLDVNQPAFRHDVGYGNLVPGELIDVKSLGDVRDAVGSADGSVDRSRRRALNPV